MAIMSFVIIVAGRAFSDSTRMRVRSQNMLASSEEAGRVTALLKEDISQMGAKSWEVLVSSASSFVVAEGVYNNSLTDKSSYALDNGNANFDKFEFNKVLYKNDGTCRAVLHITWIVDNKILYRRCESKNDAKCPISPSLTDDECPASLVMAKNVEMFKFEPSKPGTDASLSSSSASAITYNLKNKTGTVLVGDDDNSLYNFTKATSGNPAHSVVCLATTSIGGCSTFKFIAGEEYAIDFILSVPSPEKNYMARFQPVTDHLAIGIRKSDKPVIPDFLFYPPQDGNDKSEHFEFSVPLDQTDANIYITAAFYSDAYNAGKGDLIFKNIKVSRKTNEVYHFPSSAYSPSGSSKADVKAFRLTLKIDKKNEVSTTTTVIPVPNNGVIPSGGT